MEADLVIRSRRVVQPSGVGPAAVHIRQEKIARVADHGDVPAGSALWDAGDSLVMPGLVDTHVHLNEPGRTDWEGFACGTRAAAAGGITTLVEMPLNSIPVTTTREALEAKIKAADGQCWVDVGFWAGVVPENKRELGELFAAGVFGFKCFLVPSGIQEFGPVTEADLRAVLPELASLGATLLVHAELPGPIEQASSKRPASRPVSYSAWLDSRPREAENRAIELLAGLSREFGARIHIVHLSSAEALPALRRAKQEKVAVTVETCPHYLCLASEEIPDGATEFKCAPPIRQRENQEKLWAALAEGTIDFVVSDHSPCPAELKCGRSGDFLKAWGGVSSLQLGLPVVWTAARQRGHTLEQLAKWMCRGPARLAGLEHRKGVIAVGCNADLVVWNPEAHLAVEPGRLHHRHRLTPYAGQELCGVVEATFLRGRKIYEQGAFPGGPSGAMLRRETW